MGKPTLQLNTYLGPYYLVKLIAIGGMAEIYLATTKGLAGFEKQLALKVIHPDYADDNRFVQMLVDEAKITVKLNHPNIAQTFDLGKIENCYFISMEFVDGADFFQVLKRTSELRDDFPVESALLVVSEALCGLSYAHNKSEDDGQPLSIIHRDISPQNILISRHGEVKLVDFGIAKAANLSTKTRAGVIKGKLVYMSPEQSWGDKVDQRTDIFSAGIVLYEALTGGSLYMEKNPVKLLEMVRKAEIPPPSSRRPADISPELDALVMKALSPKPDHRYQTAMEFAETLTGYLRRLSPDFSNQHLGDQIEAVLMGQKPSTILSLPRANAEQQNMMLREDFEVQEHSVIFSPDDMLAVAAQQDGQGGSRPTSAMQLRARLVLLDESSGDTPYPLGEHFIIGRAGDLRLGDARVSRRHAKVVLVEGQFVLEDMQSANGTFLNEEKVLIPRVLNNGDMIRTGPFKIRFDLLEQPQLQQPQPQPVPPPVPVVAQGAAPPSMVDPTLESEPSPVQGPRSAGGQDEMPHPTGPQQPPNQDRTGSSEVLADGAAVILIMGQEQLSLSVGDRLPLCHTLCMDATDVVGESASLVRRADGYWLEPIPGKPCIQINGQQLSVPVQLSGGDKLRIGPLELEFAMPVK